MNQIANRLSFISLSFLSRRNSNAYANKYGKNFDNFREHNASVKNKSPSVGEFKYILAVIYAVFEI